MGYITIEGPIAADKDVFVLVDKKLIYKHQLHYGEYRNTNNGAQDTSEIIDFK